MEIEGFMSIRLTKLAELTKVPKTSWSRYFSGKRDISVQTLNKAAARLDIQPELLLSWINIRRAKSNGKVV